MDPLEQILFMIWMLVLPVVAITLMVLIPIFWFFIVPKISRRLTWARFGNKTLVAFGDDHGYADIQVSRGSMPEGVVETKNGYYFLPRRTRTDDECMETYDVSTEFMYKKFILKDHGKPLWFGYVGKVGLMNPATLSVIAGIKVTGNPNNPASRIEELKPIINTLPKNVPKTVLKKMREIIKSATEKKQEGTQRDLTLMDPTIIKQVIPRNYTPSQLESYGKKRELIGMLKAGSQISKYVMGIGVLIILLVLSVVVIMVITQSGMFSPQPTQGNISGIVFLWKNLLSLSPSVLPYL